MIRSSNWPMLASQLLNMIQGMEVLQPKMPPLVGSWNSEETKILFWALFVQRLRKRHSTGRVILMEKKAVVFIKGPPI